MVEIIAALSTLASAVSTIVSLLKGLKDLSDLLGPLMPLIGSILTVVGVIVLAIVLSIVLLPLAPFILLAAAIVIIILLLIGITLTAIAVLLFAAWHALTALPLFILARKAKCKYAWLVWLPVPLVYDYVLFTLPGNRPFCLFGKKVPIKDRWIPWLLYLSCPIVTMLFSAIPYVGSILSTIYTIFCLYLYALALKDVVSLFRDSAAGNTVAGIVAVLADTYVFFDLSIAASILLYLVCGKPLLPEETVQPVAPEVPAIVDAPIPAELPETPEIIAIPEDVVE